MYFSPAWRNKQLNPDAEFIKDILNRGLDYWSDEASLEIVGYDGDSSNVSFRDGSSNAPSLMFFKVEKYGFFIMELPGYKAPYRQMDEIDLVPFEIGGEWFFTPSCCYFSVEETAEMLTSFVENQYIVDFDEWKDIYELIEEHGFEEDDEYSSDNHHEYVFYGYGKYFDKDANFIGKPK